MVVGVLRRIVGQRIEPVRQFPCVEQAIAIGTGPLRRQDRNAALPWLEYALRRDPWNSEAAGAMSSSLISAAILFIRIVSAAL